MLYPLSDLPLRRCPQPRQTRSWLGSSRSSALTLMRKGRIHGAGSGRRAFLSASIDTCLMAADYPAWRNTPSFPRFANSFARFPNSFAKFLNSFLRFPNSFARFPNSILRFRNSFARVINSFLKFANSCAKFPNSFLRFPNSFARFGNSFARCRLAISLRSRRSTRNCARYWW